MADDVLAPREKRRSPRARPRPRSGCGPGWPASAAQSGADPVLEPLFKVVRATHPKADLAIVEKAYQTAEQYHRGQTRDSGDPYITHPLAVTSILAELGMTPPTLCAALLHDTVEDTPYTLDQLTRRLRRRGRAARRRRDQARQGQVRRRRAGRDHPQDDRRDEQGHPGPGHQARRPAAQHAHAAVPPAGDKQERIASETLEIYAPLAHRLGMNTVKWELEDLAFATLAPEGLRRDRPAGRRARAGARRVPGHA